MAGKIIMASIAASAWRRKRRMWRSASAKISENEIRNNGEENG
jgi:hypothetical protein